MRILVPGATGNVGRLVVEQALERGHEVVAVARNPETVGLEHPRLGVAAVDILDPSAVRDSLDGVDAVVSCVGIGASKTPTVLYSQGTKNLVAGMAAHGVERLVVISSEVAEHWAHQGPLKRGWAITACDMATALLDLAERDDLDRRHVYVAN